MLSSFGRVSQLEKKKRLHNRILKHLSKISETLRLFAKNVGRNVSWKKLRHLGNKEEQGINVKYFELGGHSSFPTFKKPWRQVLEFLFGMFL